MKLKELSARLGLSPTTVSRALSGYSDVSPSTRERVEQFAREVGYQPNRAARQVAMGRADAVGIVYSPASEFLGNTSFREMLEGVAHTLEQINCDLLLASAPRHNELGVYQRMVNGRRVDAMLVAHTLRVDPRVDYLRSSGFPFLAYGRTHNCDGFPWFDFDNTLGSKMAVRRLAALGHQRIGYVHAPLEYNFAHLRHLGFLEGMKESGLLPLREMMVGGSLDRRSGYQAALTLLALSPRPTAVLVDNNSGGVGVLRALLDAGLTIGRDMSVIINEGVPLDTLFTHLTVAAVLQPTPYQSGQTMGEMLLAMVERKPLTATTVLRQPILQDGNTIGPAPR
jgi:LacI family transcriptional regulator